MIVSKMVFYTSLEAAFIILLILVFWIAALRKTSKKKEQIINELKNSINSLKKHSDSQQAPPANPVPTQKKKLSATQSNSLKVLKVKLKKSKKELRSKQQQLSNMQQYKQLYFKLEALLSEQDKDNTQGNEERIDLLEKTLEEQEKYIEEMKTLVEKEPFEDKEKYIEQLERTIKQLEASNGSLKNEVTRQENELSIAEQRNDEIQQYRSKAITLQNNEKRLNTKIIGLKTELNSATEEIEKNSEKLGKYKKLKKTLDEKDTEIEHLRQECEILGSQYHDLAAKSLADVGEDISEEKKKEMESLRTTLQETIDELDRKRAECEMLEQSYLDLDIDDELDKKATELESSLADRSALEKTAKWLTERAVELNENETGNELEKLKTLLETKSESLTQHKNEQEQIESKIIELSEGNFSDTEKKLADIKNEKEKINEKYEKTKKENKKLKEELDALYKLQDEYNSLEKRYLALAQDSISR